MKRIDSVINNNKNLVTSDAIYNAIGDVVGYTAFTIAVNADFNNVYVDNKLRFYNGAYSVSRKNAPNGWAGGMMMCYKSLSFGFQMCFDYISTNIFVRTYYSNRGWNEWKTISLS